MHQASRTSHRSYKSFRSYGTIFICAFVSASAFAASPLDSVIRETGLRPPKHGVYVVAHRGAHDGPPENTLAAYQRAIDLECDFVEIDVRVTKDGHLVSVHNATVDAYTQDAKGAVRDFTLAELKALDIGSRIGPEWRNERIPTVDEIIALCNGKIGLYLDVKEPAVIPALLALVTHNGMQRDALWYTGVPQQLAVQKDCPECLLMPDPGPDHNLEATIARFETKPRIIASVMKFCSESFVEVAHTRGAIVITDESSPDDWPTMLARGIDGIQTDHPAELIQYLKGPRADTTKQQPSVVTQSSP